MSLPAPFWWDAQDCPWACTRGAAPRLLETTDECTTCAAWEPRVGERSEAAGAAGVTGQARLRERMAAIRRKILILSGKGGVGKSTVAVNLAVALAGAGRSVGLLDVDVHGPSVPKLTGLEGRTIPSEGSILRPVSLLPHLTVMSVDFLLTRPGAAVVWRGPLKSRLIRQFLTDVAWGPLDDLVVDCPPGTGDEALSVARLAGPRAAAIVVTTPQDVSIVDVRRCVTFCRAVSLPVFGILENMSGLVCPHCHGRIDLFKRGGGEALAREMGVPFLGSVPIDPAIVTSGDLGVPVVRNGGRLPAAVAFLDLAARIVETDFPVAAEASHVEHEHA
jgi:Mrp family chromosome partitioning ATPase